MSGSISSCNLSFSDGEIRTILLTYGLTGVVSVFICLFAVVLVLFFKLYQKFMYRLATYQVLSALFFGTARSLQLMSYNDREFEFHSPVYNKLCITVAFITISSSWMKLAFTMWVTVHVFVYSVWFKSMERLEKICILSSVLIGPIIGAIPIFTDSYGRAGPWCWIKNHRNPCNRSTYLEGEFQQFCVWYGPAFIVLVLASLLVLGTLLVLICRIHFKKCLNLKKDESLPLLNTLLSNYKRVLHLALPLLAYPLIFCLLIVIPLLNRLYEAVSKKSNYLLFLATAFCIPAMSCAAGIALIIHILISKCSEWRRLTTNLVQQQEVKEVSTAATTSTVLPRESELDSAGFVIIN